MHHGQYHHRRLRLEEDHQREVEEEVEEERPQGEGEVVEEEQQHQGAEVEVVVVEQRVLLLLPASRPLARRKLLQLGALVEEEGVRWDCPLVQELRISTHPLHSKV
jgi:hypothetical protein